MAALLANVLVFGRLLRTLGMEVHVGRLLDIAEALQHVDIGAREDVYHACRALLVHRREDLAVFDRAFDAFWREQGDFSIPAPRRPEGDPRKDGLGSGGQAHLESPGVALPQQAADAPSGILQTWSDAQTLAHKDFAEYTAAEVALARAAMQRLEWRPGDRRTRRWVRGHGPGVDLRRALAHSVRTGGDVFKLPRRHRRMRERPVVLLCDVSGSMERYSRMLLHFAHAIGRRQRRVEVFVFSTNLTRVTTELGARGLDAAAAEVSRSVPGWSGAPALATRSGSSISSGRAVRSGADRSSCSSRTAGIVATRCCCASRSSACSGAVIASSGSTPSSAHSTMRP